MCMRELKSGSRRHNLILEDLHYYFADSCSDSWVSPEPLRVTFVICPVTFCVRRPAQTDLASPNSPFRLF